MKKMIKWTWLLSLAILISGSAFAQSEKSDSALSDSLPSPLCLSSTELLNMACSIESNTLIGNITFLAVVSCLIDSTSRLGFYIKIGDKDEWCWIVSKLSMSGDYIPTQVIGYKDAVAHMKINTSIKGARNPERLVVLIYRDNRYHELFDIFDLGSKKVLERD